MSTRDAQSLRSLRNLYSIKAILEMDKKVIVCPLPYHAHVNHTPSFSVYSNREGYEKFLCHGCGTEGDVIDLIGFMVLGRDYNPSSPKDVGRAIEMLIKGYKLSPPELSKPKPRGLSYELWKAFPLGEQVISYGGNRGLTAETLQAFGVGQADKSNLYDLLKGAGLDPAWLSSQVFMTMPTFHHGKLIGIKLRNIKSAGKRNRFFQFPGSSPGLFGMGNIYNTSEPIVIVKGEISTMNLWQRGLIHTAAPNCGEAMVDSAWGIWTSWSKKVIVIGDNDPEQIKNQLSKAYLKRCETFRADLRFPPEKYHDVDDWLLGDPGAIDEIQGWLL